MALTIIDTGASAQVLSYLDELIVTRNGSVTSTVSNNPAISTANTDYFTRIDIYGLVASSGYTINMTGTSSGGFSTTGNGGNLVHVGATGVVTSTENSVGAAMRFYGSYNEVVNEGTIFANKDGIYFHGANAQVSNSGSLSAANGNGVRIDATGDMSDVARIRNDGTIDAQSIGIYHTNGGGQLDVFNTGTIHGNVGIQHVAGTNNGSLTVFNSGTIQGISRAILVYGDADREITNRGMIVGRLDLSNGDEVVRNSGSIDGDINFMGGNDSLFGFGGTVTGIVDGGAGDDVFYLDDPSTVVDGGADYDIVYLRADMRQVTNVELIQLEGGGGLSVWDDDTATRINGNIGNNVLNGAGGNDTLRGGQGLDELNGGDDDDLIFGNSGEDEIDGGNGADQIFGGRGADEIFGGFGQDTIAGGAGDDTISGGGAKDILSGGYGNDVFLFESAADAGSGSSADIINGFVRGEDVIDLQAIGTTPASFIGTAGFSGSGNMEVRYTVNGFGNALVRIDEDGNGTEDARIVVAQTALLDAADFLL